VSGGDLEPADGDLALVVASHGRDELGALRAGLEARLPYVGLVASRLRGEAVAAELRAAGVPEDRLRTLDTPAGIAIGAVTAREIALSILARIVAVRRRDEAAPVRVPAVTAVDPVCGMEVAVGPDTPRAEHEGRLVHFCCDGCRASFEQDPARFAAAL
jgi:xanthine dehydrogenase accessory factor